MESELSKLREWWILGVGPTLQPCRRHCRLNFFKIPSYHQKNSDQDLSFQWSNICRKIRSWLFGSPNMGIFCQITNLPILLNISRSQVQSKNGFFFQTAQKSTFRFSTKMLDLSNERPWPEFFQNKTMYSKIFI